MDKTYRFLVSLASTYAFVLVFLGILRFSPRPVEAASTLEPCYEICSNPQGWENNDTRNIWAMFRFDWQCRAGEQVTTPACQWSIVYDMYNSRTGAHIGVKWYSFTAGCDTSDTLIYGFNFGRLPFDEYVVGVQVYRNNLAAAQQQYRLHIDGCAKYYYTFWNGF